MVSRRISLSFIFSFTVLLVQYKYSNAQDQPYKEVTIASPNASSLGKYADIPISYHTGLPQINIPLYTVKAGPLELPISVSYHASGLKVMEPASWVGAGWALNAGGVITRTVMGGPDERATNTGFTETNGYFSDYGYNNYLYNAGMQDWAAFSEGRKDGEPDLFFYNFGGYSGKFYFNDDRTPVLVPETDLKVEYDYSPGAGQNINSFTLTTPDGTKYSFGKTIASNDVDPIEVTSCYKANTGLNSGSVVSSWFLNNITSADNKFSIDLHYVTENYGYPTISMFALDNTYDSHHPYEYEVVKNLIQGVRLHDISFPNGTVIFNAGTVRTDLCDYTTNLNDNVNTTAVALGSIEISNTSASFHKRFDFSYSYFPSDESPLTGYFSGYQTDKIRLRLDQIQEKSFDQTVIIPPHIFTYFDGQVPRRLSFGQDHWGFSNGVTGNTTLIPTYTLNNGNTITTITGANRDAAWPAMEAGELKRITYPTGGYTEFEFEGHRTFTSKPSYSVTQVDNISIGFSNSNTHFEHSIQLNPGSYQLSLENHNGSQTAGSSLSGPGININITATTNNITLYNFTITQSGSYIFTIDMQRTVNDPTDAGAQGKINQLSFFTLEENTLVGGLRISKMTHNDGITTKNIVTTYSYTTPVAGQQRSSGILYSRPTYVAVPRNDLIKTLGYWSPSGFTQGCSANGCIGCDFGGQPYYKSGATVRPMSTTQGSHIGYSEVQVTQTGNGHSVYRYYGTSPWTTTNDDVAFRSFNPTTCDANVPNYPPAPLPNDFKRGELQYESHWAEDGTLLKETSYLPQYQDNPVTTPGFIVAARNNSGVTQLLGTFYTLTTARKTQMQVSETLHDQSGGSITTTTTTYFGSAFHHAPTKKDVTVSNNLSSEQQSTYAFDIRVPSCDGIADGWQDFQNANSTCLTQYGTASNACSPTDNVCKTNALLAYQSCLSQARNNYVTYRRSNFTDNGNAYKTCMLNAPNSASTSLKPIITLRNQFQNAPLEMSDWKDGKLLKATFNSFDYAQDDPNIVYIKQTRQINLAAPATAFASANNNNGSLSTDSRYEDEVAITISNGNIKDFVKKDGLRSSYIWDYHNSYPIAKIINAINDQVAYTSFEADGSGNWTISPSGISNTPGITGTKSYQLSSGISLSKNGISSGSKYIISCWCNSAQFSISGASIDNTKVGKTIGIWTLYQFDVTATGTSINITGTCLIDEVRLYPSSAQMSTYTYDPLTGIKSECDVNSKLLYYEYDALGRLKLIRNEDNYILKTFSYQYQEVQ
jgi:hypothetical protein